MDHALIADTDTVVSANDLPTLHDVVGTSFVCPGCHCRLIAKSYAPGKKQIPHFAKATDAIHMNCEVDGAEKLVGESASGSARTQVTTKPSSYPGKLRLDNEPRDVTDSSGTTTTEPESHSTRTPRSQRRPTDGSRIRTAKTIRPICEVFVEYPLLHRELSIEIPGIDDAKKYHFAFRKIKSASMLIEHRRILRAPVRRNADPTETTESFNFELFVGDWIDSTLVRPCRVHVDWNGWSQGERRALADEFERVREKAREAAHTGRDMFVFFMGDQDGDDLAQFRVNDYRLICFLLADKKDPHPPITSAAPPDSPRGTTRRSGTRAPGLRYGSRKRG